VLFSGRSQLFCSTLSTPRSAGVLRSDPLATNVQQELSWFRSPRKRSQPPVALTIASESAKTTRLEAGATAIFWGFLSAGSISQTFTATAHAASPPASGPVVASTLSARYPGDVGLAADASVVLYENFEEGSVAAVIARYDAVAHPSGMTLVRDHPAYSSGTYALRLTSGGANAATHLYKRFGTGYDELFFRYYIKYLGDGPWHHSGLWFGGYDPPLAYPFPRTGSKPNGDDLFSIALEPMPNAGRMDFFNYWMGMHSWKAEPTGVRGDYWGNTLLHSGEFRVASDSWVCYEIHLKLNPNPAAGAGAVLEVWQNDTLVRRFDDAGPPGYWVRDKFCPADADGAECTTYRPANPVLVGLDQQWRRSATLKINYLWPQNYNTASSDSSLLLDDMVVATRRIGCTVKP
jgi:hypothetical protein